MKRDAQKTYDVVVIGAGPGGLTAATLLALQGHRVAVLEKTTFPRYRVGESMIPYNYFPLERIGMIEKLQASVLFRSTYGSSGFTDLAGHPQPVRCDADG
jgi:2-polyprenyl-6-methoxyphenol hydroxylase-like FAD-dependent oxidoreductase